MKTWWRSTRSVEKSHPGHPELPRFYDEAQSIIASGQDASAVTISL